MVISQKLFKFLLMKNTERYTIINSICNGGKIEINVNYFLYNIKEKLTKQELTIETRDFNLIIA